MSKYAFGLWQYGINPKGVHSNELVVRPAGEFPHGAWIADCGVKTDPKAVANARLIAAAPDLLAALEEAYSELLADSHRDGPRCLLLTTIEEALAKARAA